MKNKLGILLRFVGFGLLFFILSKSSIQGICTPFAYPMLFALAWAGQKVWIVAPAYILGTLWGNLSFEGAISIICTVTLLAVPYYIHLLAKKPMKSWELFLFTAISQTAGVIFEVPGGHWLAGVLHLVIGLVYLQLCLSLFQPLLMRGFAYKLTLMEMASGAVLLLTFGGGLANCDAGGFSFLKLLVAFGLLLLSRVGSVGQTLLFASLMGIGSLLSTCNPLYIAPFIIWAVAVIIFRKLNRFFAPLALCLSEVMVVFLFELYYSFSIFTFLPIILSCIGFCLIPQRVFNKISTLISPSPERLAVKNLLNRNRETLQRRLRNLGEVFYEMNGVFRKLIKREAGEEEGKEMLYEEVKKSVCANCPENRHCHRTFCEDTHGIFKNLVTIAMERGKITLLDLPSYLSSRCGKANVLINEINTLTSQYKSYRNLVSNIDISKLLISDQLEGVSCLMKTLAGEVDTMIAIAPEREERVKEELSSSGIICTDAIIYEKDAHSTMATLVVRDEDSDKIKLQRIVSKICGHPMAVYSVYPTERAGLVSVNLKTAPRFDCIFGLAQCQKSGSTTSGDRHSIERLDGDKFIFAICDGMGSGERAGEKAETAIGLIENFYKAGFESDLVLSSVNKLLNLERDDIFSSIDVCVVDLKNGLADFIKMGSATSYIRGREGCKIVECSSLPVGVLDNAKALTQKVVLQDKDYIILCSDGVNDAFESDNHFKDFLLTIKEQNPQEQADIILQSALSKNNGYAVDDMTVLVVKIF